MASLLPTTIYMDASHLGRPNLFLTACLLLLSSLLFGILYKGIAQQLRFPNPLEVEFPDVLSRKRAYATSARKLLQKYHKQFKTQPFLMDTMDGRTKVVLPLSAMDELKSHPALSFKACIDRVSTLVPSDFILLEAMLTDACEDVMTDYTGVGQIYDWGIHEIRAKMNPSLGAYVPTFHNIIRKHLSMSLGEPTDWTPVEIHNHIVELVTKLSARIMQGEQAANNPEWIKFATSFVGIAAEYSSALKQWPEFLRPIVANFLPERIEMKKCQIEGRKIVAKSMDKRRTLGSATSEGPPTMLDHLSSGNHANKADDLDLQLWLQMALTAVSIHTTSSTMIQALYDLAAYPEHIPELRAEVHDVLGRFDGVLTKESLGEMKKLDSWIKESFRMGGPDLATFERIATKPFTLKDGTHIPAGTRMEVPTVAINFDPSIYPNPEKFDGFRSYRKRQEDGMAHKHSFVSVTRNELGWGFGKRACPGRFLSDVVIKLVFAEFLLNYEAKNLIGQPRPKNLDFGVLVMPDSKHQILIKALKA